MLDKFPVTAMPVLGGVVAGKTETVNSVVAPGETVLGFAPPPTSKVVPPPPHGLGAVEVLRGTDGFRFEKSF